MKVSSRLFGSLGRPLGDPPINTGSARRTAALHELTIPIVFFFLGFRSTELQVPDGANNGGASRSVSWGTQCRGKTACGTAGFESLRGGRGATAMDALRRGVSHFELRSPKTANWPIEGMGKAQRDAAFGVAGRRRLHFIEPRCTRFRRDR